MRQASRRTKALLLAAVVAATAIAVSIAISSTHREAPNIMLDPSADNTDVYAYTADDAQGAITVVANWIPGQNPANGPNFFRFDDRAHYYIKFDNDGDGVEDVSYRFEFETDIRNPNSFLYARPGTRRSTTRSLNVVQRYDVIRETVSRKGKVKEKTVGKNRRSPRRTSARRRSRTTTLRR